MYPIPNTPIAIGKRKAVTALKNQCENEPMAEGQAFSADTELQDAEKVNQALVYLREGRMSASEELLKAVIRNTPEKYTYQKQDRDSLCVKFWDQEEFFHYVTWQQDKKIEQTVTWMPSAYPRALYYLGFIEVEKGNFETAIGFLEFGQDLEPTNPNFYCEQAHAHSRIGNHERAIELYGAVNQVGPHTNGHVLAKAMRGRGMSLIELGRIDEAESLFWDSLKLDPENEIAVHELRYIKHLRAGGDRTELGMAVAKWRDHTSHCHLCGEPMESMESGVLVGVNESPVVVCNRCHRKVTKRWWEFWK